MLDWFNAMFSAFKKVVVMLFQLPFYGDITVGYLFVAIAVFYIIFQLFYRRMV